MLPLLRRHGGPCECRLAVHGVPDRLAQLAAYGNALVPQIAEWLGTQILDYERGRLAA